MSEDTVTAFCIRRWPLSDLFSRRSGHPCKGLCARKGTSAGPACLSERQIRIQMGRYRFDGTCKVIKQPASGQS